MNKLAKTTGHFITVTKNNEKNDITILLGSALSSDNKETIFHIYYSDEFLLMDNITNNKRILTKDLSAEIRSEIISEQEIINIISSKFVSSIQENFGLDDSFVEYIEC